MKLDQGQDSLPSKMGAISSLFVISLLLVYTYYKFTIMDRKKDVDILSAVRENHFGLDHVFGNDQGLNIAVAVFQPFDPSTLMQLDHSYGRIRFQKFFWGPTENVFEVGVEEIDSHACTPEELGITSNENQKFWQITEAQEIILEAAQGTFVCVDP